MSFVGWAKEQQLDVPVKSHTCHENVRVESHRFDYHIYPIAEYKGQYLSQAALQELRIQPSGHIIYSGTKRMWIKTESVLLHLEINIIWMSPKP